MIFELIGAIGIAIVLIPLILMLVFLSQGNMAGAVGAGAFLLFLISPGLCILLLLVGTVMSLVIGRQDLSRVCIICLIVFIAFYAVLLIAGFATIALFGA